jgi:hypothetical protein
MDDVVAVDQQVGERGGHAEEFQVSGFMFQVLYGIGANLKP